MPRRRHTPEKQHVPRRPQAALAGGQHRDPLLPVPECLSRGKVQEALRGGRVGFGIRVELIKIPWDSLWDPEDPLGLFPRLSGGNDSPHSSCFSSHHLIPSIS